MVVLDEVAALVDYVGGHGDRMDGLWWRCSFGHGAHLLSVHIVLVAENIGRGK